MVDVARAGVEDLEQLVEIGRRRRDEYAAYQPQFWHPAPDAVDRQRAFFRALLGDPEVVVLVARDGTTVDGLAIARLVPAPPVYDPGGPSCVVGRLHRGRPGGVVDGRATAARGRTEVGH